MTNQLIPVTAVEAAARAFIEHGTLLPALEAAAPHMLSHEREETQLAHLDAVVNARTVDKLNAAIEAVLALTCEPDSIAVPHNQPDLVPPWYSDRIRAAITKALSE